MPASISSVTTMGFSNGTFNGSVALVVTLGYGIGEAAAVIPTFSITRRGVLIGQSNERLTLIGQSNERRVLTGYDK